MNNLIKRKNYLALVLLLGWVALVFFITIVKIEENGTKAVRPIAEEQSHTESTETQDTP